MIRFISIGFLCILVGCTDHTSLSVKTTNTQTLSQPGDLVGKLPDGREVRRWKIDMGNSIGSHDHWIYVTGNDVTLNHAVKQGKSSVNVTETIIGNK